MVSRTLILQTVNLSVDEVARVSREICNTSRRSLQGLFLRLVKKPSRSFGKILLLAFFVYRNSCNCVYLHTQGKHVALLIVL